MIEVFLCKGGAVRLYQTLARLWKGGGERESCGKKPGIRSEGLSLQKIAVGNRQTGKERHQSCSPGRNTGGTGDEIT